MIKKAFFIVLLLFLIFITACTNDEPPAADDDVAIVYCSNYYDASYGEFGYFTITPFEDIELETKYDDLSSFKLGEAFSNMLIKEIRLNEDGYSIDVCVIGELTTGKYGTFEGNGLVKNKNVKVNVPINEAFAVSDSIIYSNVKEQTVVIDLWSTCFKKELTVADFVLSGAAEDMQIKAIEFENYENFDEKFYPQTVILTLTGDPNGLSYAYIDILDAATTYNEDIRVVINTDFYGGTILNENIDTYTNYDTVYVELNNLTFKSDLEITDIVADEDRERIRKGLVEYNLSQLEDKSPKELGIYYKVEGEIKAGLIGETHGNWLEIDYLWVSEKLRNRGIGSSLLAAAEKEALRRNCKYCFLNTFGFVIISISGIRVFKIH